MGVYIPDMKLPSSCLMCDIPVRVQPCPVDHDNVSNYKTSRHPACPLIHVPPHGRLIDADRVSLEGGPYEYDEWCKWALDQYQDAPTIIPAEPDEEIEENE